MDWNMDLAFLADFCYNFVLSLCCRAVTLWQPHLGTTRLP